MSVQLTAGGKTYQPPIQPNPNEPHVVLDRWHSALTKMLDLAIDYGKLDALATKRKDWCDHNPWHELHDERHAVMWHTRMERNARGGRLMDLAADLSRLQGLMPPHMIDGLSALIGHPLWPYVGHRWALTAARMQTADIFSIAGQVLMDLRAEDEEMIGGTV